MKVFFLVALSLLSIWTAHSSVEGAVSMDEFRFASKASQLEILGSRNSSGRWTELEVKAFGKVFSVPPETLSPLKESFINGIMVSEEGGYSVTGGKTVYITLLFGFTSGVAESWILSVNEQGGITFTQAKKAEQGAAANP